MGDSEQKKKGKGSYNQWTTQETNTLLELVVNGIKSGWRDVNGGIKKLTVEEKILLVVNHRLGCQKNHENYVNRMKVLRNRYKMFSELMRYSSGFGWDSVSQRFTSGDEVWDDYSKSHPTHNFLRNEKFTYYEDLALVFGNGTAVGKHSMRLGDDTDAQKYGDEENRPIRLDENVIDDYNEYETPNITLSPADFNISPFRDTYFEAPKEKLHARKRSRPEFEANSSSAETLTRPDLVENVCVGMESVGAIANEFRAMRNLLEKREHDRENREIEKNELEKYNIWDPIKETPNLENRARYKAVALIHQLGMKSAFLKMSPEERSKWIKYSVE